MADTYDDADVYISSLSRKKQPQTPADLRSAQEHDQRKKDTFRRSGSTRL